MPRGAGGGPVFDASGRVAGITIRGRIEGVHLIPVRLLREAGVVVVPPAQAGTRVAQEPRLAADEIYELAMRVTLQVIATHR